jgi:two-component system invasion response regulator UvrY
MVRLIVADDHAVVRTGLQLIFQDIPNFEIIAEVSNGDELLQLLNTEKTDLVIVDMNMPGKDSLDLIANIQKDHASIKIVVFTMNTDEQLALRLFKLGVKAYINKEEPSDVIIEAVKKASFNEVFLTKQQQNTFASKLINGEEEILAHEKLTDKEYQVFCLLTEGKSKTEISEKLQISKNTISNHRNNILKKLNLNNTVELTRYAIENHII